MLNFRGLILTYTDKEVQVYSNIINCEAPSIKDLFVRYHCGGWSEELNSRILHLAYMVYLKPKHSLGYYLLRHSSIVIYTYTG